MLRRAKELDGCAIRATDGEIGEVKDVFFDVDAWTVRYFVVETGNWLRHRRVLVAPEVAGRPMNADGGCELPVRLTQEQVRESPDVDTHRPFGRQRELAYREYYAWPIYWPTGMFTAGGVGMAPPMVTQDEQQASAEPEHVAEGAEDQRLRSMGEVRGYVLRASDGDIGHVRDFILDDESWGVRYIVVDTGNWLPSKDVLVAPSWISSVSWSDNEVVVELRRDEVKTAPEYHESDGVTADYERALREHYRRAA
jgi:uncharacterized protein YrrD